MEPDDLLCSRNARPQKALVGRAQWKLTQPPSLKIQRASLEGSYISFDTRKRIDQAPLREQAEGQSAHEGHCAMAQKLHHFIYGEMAEGTRFEATPASETIGPDLLLSFRSQSLTAESETDETPIKIDWTR
jgi:hypothetical protein